MINSEIITFSDGGNSFPVVLKQCNAYFFVKLRAGMSGEFALLNEWFCSKVGFYLGLPVLLPRWIILTPDLHYANLYVEVRELIEKSMGRNIGFEYIENVRDIADHELATVENDMLADIFLFDLVMFNIDRTNSNINLLKSYDRIIVADFDSCMLFNEMFSEAAYSTNERILQCLRANPLYACVSSEQVCSFIGRLCNVPFYDILDEIPDDVLNADCRDVIKYGLSLRIANNWNLSYLLEKLEQVQIETSKQRDTRIRGNRDRFVRGLLNGC